MTEHKVVPVKVATYKDIYLKVPWERRKCSVLTRFVRAQPTRTAAAGDANGD